ncbi:LysM peptidoglycan-binding domain-containing protein [Virgibacillus ndiopensis]|uniref:C40 family peptidase n=1 Tax=Virgibacillus ndiopensis TaxID=2004408 RepID=UPI000C07D4FA|nr:LysM peptidoglycan-binding domain-containing protein [Virgibacillus ndiopensis]
MANKKLFMSVTASAVIASAFVATDEAEAASYKVKSGDSLWSIAQQFDTNVTSLKTINNLSSNIIFPNQVLETNKKQSSTKPTTNTSTNKTTTYTVKPGDTLSGIAFKHNISLADLMKWNDLDSTLIYPGNVFKVSAGSSSDSSGANNSGNKDSGKTSTPPKEQVGSSKVYTVKSGDTLSGIASRNGVSVSELKKWNGLSSDLILIGQKLNIGGEVAADSGSGSGNSASETPVADVDYNVSKLISVAKSMTGVDYAWGGSTPSGFDCSGFIYYTYKKAGMNISRLSSGGYYNRSFYVNKPVPGDLVFFENTYKSGISHLGIYLGGNQFIHAGSSGVQISNLSSSYWSKHFEGYKRFY